MRVLFLVPPSYITGRRVVVDRVYGCNYGYDYKPPVHLLMLATFLQVQGCIVRVLDCPAESIETNAFVLHLSEHKYDVVVFFTTWLAADIDILAANICREKMNGCRIIFTGPYPTWKPELFLLNNDCCVIRGEPEIALGEVVKSWGTDQRTLFDISGISYIVNKSIVHNPMCGLTDIDALPIPDRRLLKGRYSFNRVSAYPSTVMCVSRGCSYQCTYCAPHAMDQSIELENVSQGLPKPILRLRSVDNIIAEFKEIASLGYKGVEICDNQFVWDANRVVRICQAIIPLKLKWVCYARADHVNDQKMLALMKQAGCFLIYIGTESFDQRILNDICKQCSVSDCKVAVKAVQAAGIDAEVSVLMGASQFETRATITRSIQAAREMGTRFVHYSIALPLPNTRLYKAAIENGWMKDGEFSPVDNVRQGIMDLPGIKAVEMRSLIKEAYCRQYLSANFIIKEIGNLRSWSVLLQKFRALLRFVVYLFGRS